MASVVSICNLALSNVGKTNISALTEASAEARACNQFYEHVRDVMLQVYPWRFAAKTASLAEVTNDKPGSWEYAYSRPTDCLKVRWLRSEYSETEPTNTTIGQEIANPYEAEGGTIYCDLSPAFLRYTFKQTDPTRFSLLFIEALSWQLAVRLAMPLTRDPKVRQDAYQLARQLLATAEAHDANETRNTSDISGDFTEARV